jgi:hypothetical protein
MGFAHDTHSSLANLLKKFFMLFGIPLKNGIPES